MITKIKENAVFKKLSEIVKACREKLSENIEKIPKSWMPHIKNIAILILSYAISSALARCEFKFLIFLKETFSLLCVYSAVFFCFSDRIDGEAPFKISICVTACIAPIFFINSSFSAAVICLLLMIICEFIAFEYARGCNLFSNLIPVYIVCENEKDAAFTKKFYNSYKVLELIILSNEKNKYSSLKSSYDIDEWLQKINRIPFYPSPKRIIYFAEHANSDNLQKLINISSSYSIHLFKAQRDTCVPYISINDCNAVAAAADKAALSSIFKGKRIWICSDGRESITDFICAITSIQSIDLTVFCESEQLMLETERKLASRCLNKNYKIKIANIDLFDLQGIKPDIFFYNMPVRFFHSGEENLKESVVKNVLDTNKLIQFAQSSKIPHVIVLSSQEALNSENWIGATQMIGELFVQFADSQNRRMYTKFKIIRLPEVQEDYPTIVNEIISSIFLNGFVSVDSLNSNHIATYHRNDVLSLLIKTIALAMKNQDTKSCVYTIMPKDRINFEDIIKNICDTFCLRANKDIQIIYDNKPDIIESDGLAATYKSLEKTSISNVFCTKFACNDPVRYETIWTIEELNNMTTRELISLVFQSLNEKINV